MSAEAEGQAVERPAGLLTELGTDRLHVGGTIRKADWQVLNAMPGDHVDHLGDLRDLSRFADGSFDVVYASHVLEHVGYRTELLQVVGSVSRILRPGGKFFVSVPDLTVLCRLFVQKDAPEALRFAVMRMMFGAQIHAHDFHYVGLWDQFLAATLFRGGFSEAFRVPTFGIFDDTSELRVAGELISLNMVAVRGDRAG